MRGKPERFADHYTQATLFWNSQTDVEKAHIIRGFRFELSRAQIPAIRTRVVAMLANVANELAASVAQGLGMPVPAALPKAIESHLCLKSRPRLRSRCSHALAMAAYAHEGLPS